MNLVNKLLKADQRVADEKETKVFLSKRLQKVLGERKPVAVTIREMNPRRINDIVDYQMKKDGTVDIKKTYDASLMMCVEGCADPDLTDKNLQDYFGCKSAKDLAEKLFKAEAGDIAKEISILSGVAEDDEDDKKQEEDVKN